MQMCDRSAAMAMEVRESAIPPPYQSNVATLAFDEERYLERDSSCLLSSIILLPKTIYGMGLEA